MAGYPKYKYSGFSWIGDIPEHWEIKRTKYVAKLYNGDSLNDEQKNAYSDFSESDETIPYIASKDIDKDSCSVDYLNGTRIPKKEKNTNGRPFSKAPAGSSLLCIEGGSAGKKRCILDREVNFVNKLCCFVPKVNGKFLFYYICSNSYWENFKQNLQGMIGGVTVTKLGTFPIPIPSDIEQQAITVYLDAECKKIDDLIAKEEKRESLLEEAKQSIITKAITKGIDPETKMKDSGVFWIGNTPELWTIKRLRFTGQSRNGLTYKPTDICPEEEGILVLRSSNIQRNRLSFDDNVYVNKLDERLLVEPGDVIICSRNGSLSLVGKSAFVESPIRATFGAFMLRYRSNENKEYAYYMVSTAVKMYKGLFSTTTVNQLVIGDFKDMMVSIPPLEEQKKIVSYIKDNTSWLEKRIDMSRKQIDLLKEYKQSLITEVVTGKRKVY